MWTLGAAMLGGALAPVSAGTQEPVLHHHGPGSADVAANDNTKPAGVAEGGVVTIRLRAAAGQWRPEGPAGPALSVEAFGVEGEPLSVPAPLIRVTEGDVLAVSIRNELPTTLTVHGLCTRGDAPCAPLDVAAGATRDVRFASGRAGTYHYWASSFGAPMPFRELAGALVIDPRDGPKAPDRVFVITEWTSLTPSQLGQVLASDDSTAAFLALRPRVTFAINGLAWPATERLTYRRGDAVRWRVINLSSQAHPMHLHGFYFTVTHLGDGRDEQAVAGGAGQRVVTQLLPSGGTMRMDWAPEREGNWLFHCHLMSHVSPDRGLTRGGGVGDAHAGHAASGAHAQHDASLGMAAMVLGITILPASSDRRASPEAAAAPPTAATAPTPDSASSRRRLTMVIGKGADAGGGPVAGFTIGERSAPEGPISSPGPVLVLRREEPVEITVVNRLDEATSIHWHGLELESFYDGVHGWSGQGRNVAPMIAPGASFVVRLTPPRSGTFIYHTHLHDYRQLSSGLYGALVVTEPEETFDPATDHVIVLGRTHVTEAASVLQDAATAVVNGLRQPLLTWRAGVRNRIRVINITPDDILAVTLRAQDAPVLWRPVTKDGAPVPAGASQAVPAKVRIAVGETYDFEYEAPPGRAGLWLDVTTAGGKWQSQARVIVK